MLPAVDAKTYPGLKREWSPPRTLTLSDGSAVQIRGGDQYPVDMPPDHTVVLVPHTFLPAIDNHVFVQTNLLELREAVELAKDNVGSARRALRISKDRIHAVLRSGLQDLLDAVHEGDDADAQDRWADFNDACVGVAVTLAAMGRELFVLTEEPEVLRRGTQTRVVGAMYRLRP
jgi:hypothetical protein